MSQHSKEMVETGTACVNESEVQKPLYSNLKYSIVGILFGIIFVKSEIISWFRIQEMFRLDSFHMYGVIGTAVFVGLISVQIIKRKKIKSFEGEPIVIQDKTFNKGQIYGGLMFGFGWAITGACPGPLYVQLGSGFTVIAVTILSAVLGTWVYGKFKDKLPH
jgi:uncharacterized membrane protein YedE/YeeE